MAPVPEHSNPHLHKLTGNSSWAARARRDDDAPFDGGAKFLRPTREVLPWLKVAVTLKKQ